MSRIPQHLNVNLGRPVVATREALDRTKKVVPFFNTRLQVANKDAVPLPELSDNIIGNFTTIMEYVILYIYPNITRENLQEIINQFNQLNNNKRFKLIHGVIERADDDDDQFQLTQQFVELINADRKIALWGYNNNYQDDEEWNSLLKELSLIQLHSIVKPNVRDLFRAIRDKFSVLNRMISNDRFPLVDVRVRGFDIDDARVAASTRNAVAAPETDRVARVAARAANLDAFRIASAAARDRARDRVRARETARAAASDALIDEEAVVQSPSARIPLSGFVRAAQVSDPFALENASTVADAIEYTPIRSFNEIGAANISRESSFDEDYEQFDEVDAEPFDEVDADTQSLGFEGANSGLTDPSALSQGNSFDELSIDDPSIPSVVPADLSREDSNSTSARRARMRAASEAARATNRLASGFNKKYLKYKQKYLKLKNKLNNNK
jgi:hypothetical protein